MNSKELPWTGERYVPQVRGTVALEHLHRYAYAAQFVKDKVVLDIACGEGYGSEIMARSASRVYGVDIDKLSVEHATKRYARTSNLSFAEGSCESIPLSDKAVDIVVSFETIEHTSEQDLFIREIKRVLKPGGFVIISSPEKAAYTVANEKGNPYHAKELTHEEFDRLLKANFTNVAMLGQQILHGSFIAGEVIDCPSAAVFEFHKLPAECAPQTGLYKPLYLIAFCSDAALPKIESSLCKQNIWESEEYDELKLKLNSALQNQYKHEPPSRKNALPHSKILSAATFLKRFPEILHVLLRGQKGIRFDVDWYLREYPEALTYGKNPYLHYALHGQFEGRKPHQQ
jgi:O-antigen biosynthesis protein